MFGEVADSESEFRSFMRQFDSSDNGAGQAAEIRTLNVTVLKECTDYPFLEMDESCRSFQLSHLFSFQSS